jgi:competence protein ComEC
MILVVSSLAASSLSFIEVGSVDPLLVWIYYLALGAAIFLSHKANLIPRATAQLKSGVAKSFHLASRLPQKWVIPPLLGLAGLVWVTAATMPDSNIHISFLDVGQGDAILIQQGNQQILVDGGPSPQAINLALGKNMPFWDRTIDLLILTHPDDDHLSGLVEVLQRFQVKRVLYPDLAYPSLGYEEWLRLIEEKDIKQTKARAGQQITLGGAVIKVLHPQITLLTGTGSDIDNNSLVLRLSAGNVSFLLTADISKEAEFKLIADRADLRSTVLKVAHHGSDTSTSPEFLAVVNPQVAIISVGADNKFGHPSKKVLDRLKNRIGSENIYRTDQQGTIEFITDGKRLWVETNR